MAGDTDEGEVQVGDRVWAYWLDGAFYFRGVVGLVNEDGMLNAIYDNGSSKPEVQVKRPDQSGKEARPIR